MKYFPYYFSKSELETKTLGKYTVLTLHVLLEDGVKPWEEESGASAAEVCEHNDMKIRRVIEGDNISWIHINEEETAIEDFFTYEEVQNSKEINLDSGALLWRTWNILLVSSNKSIATKPYGLPSDMTSRIDELISSV